MSEAADISLDDFDLEGTLASFGKPQAEEGKKAEAIKRSPEEVRRIKRKIVQLAKILAGRDMRVLPGEWWTCGFKEGSPITQVMAEYLRGDRKDLNDLPDEFFKPEDIFYPEALLYTEPEEIIDALIDHEAGHAVWSDYRNVCEVQKMAKDQGYLPSSAMDCLNGQEDPWVNNKQMKNSDHRKKRFQRYYQRWFGDLFNTIGTLPPTAAVTRLLLAKWIQERLGVVTDDEFQKMLSMGHSAAQEFFPKLLDASREYWSADTAAETAHIFREKIWPVHRELEKKGELDEEVIEMIREAIKRMKEEQAQGQSPQGQDGDQKGGQSIPFDKLPADLQEEIKDFLRNQQGKDSADKDTQSGQSSGEISKETSDKVGEALGEGTSQNEEQPPQIPEDLAGKIQEAIDKNLSENEKKNLKKVARKNLDKKQAKALEEDHGLPAGFTMKENPETGESEAVPQTATEDEKIEAEAKIAEIEAEQKNDEKKAAEFRKKIDEAKKENEIDKIMEKQDELPEDQKHDIQEAAKAKKEFLRQQRSRKIAEMKKNGFEYPEDEDLYDEYKAYEKAVMPRVKAFVEEIMHEIPKKHIIEYGDKRVTTGTELDTDALGDYGSRSLGRVFKSPEIVEQGDPRLFMVFLIDRSTSMKGKKLDESMKTAIFFSLVFEEIGSRSGRAIETSIVFFDDNVSTVKGYEEPYNKTKKRLMTESKKSGGTDLGKAVVEANDSLNKRKRLLPDYMSCLLAISDGDTFGALKGEKLSRFIKGLESYEGKKMGKHLKMGIFLRGGTQMTDDQKAAPTPMEQYFGERGKGTVVVDDFDELVPVASKTLKRVFKRMADQLFR